MKRHEIKVRTSAIKTAADLADHLERARGHRPTIPAVVAEALTRFLRDINRGNLTQQDLAKDEGGDQ